MMDKTEKKIEAFIKKYEMLEEHDRVITGVSGGPDSVCLLFMLCALREQMGFEVMVCHVNHGLRGADADADETYVKEICGKLHVPCRVFHEDVELIARKGKQSLEEAGRMARRRAFETMCRENGGTKIASAHHRDDNAETVLMNMARGTGVRGLCGIRPVRGKWIRPMLCLSRAEIVSWLDAHGIRYCLDTTNEDDDYTRNRIRHHLIPALTDQVNAGAVRHLDELSRQAQELWNYMEEQTDAAWEACVRTGKGPDAVPGHGQSASGRITVCKAPFEELPLVLKKLLLHRCIAKAAGQEKDIEAVHVEAVLELFTKQPGRSRDLPRAVAAVRTYDGVTLKKKRTQKSFPEQEGWEIRLEIPGETPIPGTGQKICCTLLDGPGDFLAKEMPQKSYTKCFDYDIIKYSLSARCRRPGDYLCIDEKGNRQKLKSYFINEKVPREERDRMLLIADGDHIVWIPGMRMSRMYQIGDQTKKILKIKIMEE